MSPTRFIETWSPFISEVDRKHITPDEIRHGWKSTQEGIRPGIDGTVDDNLSWLADWGFDLGQIRIPEQLWYGRHDRVVPISHGQWLAERIPGVESHHEDEEGHFSLVDRIPEIHHWLLSKF